MPELVLLALGVSAIAAIGVVLGRLVAPAVGRMAGREDEDAGDDGTPDR
jgi:hypothetical protein